MAENPVLARRCAAAGDRFVGPPAEVLGLAGDKTRAREIARRAGVPVLDASDPVRDAASAGELARELGFPLFIKAALGGGGRGMRLVESADALPRALEGAMREALAAFGDDTVYLDAEVLRVADPAQGTEIIGDGAYDGKACYAAAARHRGHLITPPGKKAILHREPGWTERDCAVRECRLLGRRAWKRIKGYHRRSLAESAMHRLKAAFGPSLRSRRWSNQVGEALLRAQILNSWSTPKNLFKA